MKLFRFGLRLWFTVVSVCSFLGGWIILAHAPKPVQAASEQSVVTTSLPTLAPLTPLSELGDDGNQLEDQQPFSLRPRSFSQSRPFFSTGGS